MTKVLLLAVAAGFMATSAAAEFKFTFDWSGLKLCTTGKPNTVANPRFKISGLPAGTTAVQFKLKDLDVPGYNHGGGWVKITQDGTVSANSFKYKSPCPPSGKHTYEWTATARTKKGGKKLAVAKARRKYPE
ncbi:hypothetical protein TRL7639_01876 [Falsiruegeria litorea R37]|uniref:Phospholipid-binding protein n=1 Tax=Falsiruegeria litorea R37 TaxID=1200284 RepID=A0A1Y5SHB8_9RHOB|nr:phospholipid-binding protein [Falsiruegeria litorea]SLN37865.1 hypothetical protein TRL7639_01876 [Falsiruegeria litorea R37]